MNTEGTLIPLGYGTMGKALIGSNCVNVNGSLILSLSQFGGKLLEAFEGTLETFHDVGGKFIRAGEIV